MTLLHQRERSEVSKSDEWETPKALFEWLCARYQFYPKLDVCATIKNKKSDEFIPQTFDEYKKDEYSGAVYFNGLNANWFEKNWCNPPHSETELWVKKACKEFVENGYETMMIIPANSTTTSYAECCINGIAESYPIFERPRFKQDGKEKDVARNGYYVILWRAK